MMKFKKFVAYAALPVVALSVLSGCTDKEEQEKLLNTFNTFTGYLNTGDYASAMAMTSVSESEFMTEKAFIESIEMSEYASYKDLVATDVEFNKDTNLYVYTCKGGEEVNVKFISTNTGDIIETEDLLTTVDVYVPSNATASYNQVNLDDSYITDNDEVTKTYTLDRVPISEGVLSYNAGVMGSDSRNIMPTDGDFFEMEINEALTDSALTYLTATLNEWYAKAEKAQVYTDLEFLPGKDRDQLTEMLEDIQSNRKLDNEYTKYTNVLVELRADYISSVEFVTSTTIELEMPVTVTWKIGEDKKGVMNMPYETFTLEKKETSWELLDLSDWSLITTLEVEEVDNAETDEVQTNE